jgi:predicted nucleotidyltransferase
MPLLPLLLLLLLLPPLLLLLATCSVAVATRRAFETHQHVKVQPFGSLVNGLSTWNSDVDLVVTGLVKPSRITGGFSQKDKRVVYRALDKIAHQLRRCDLAGPSSGKCDMTFTVCA